MDLARNRLLLTEFHFHVFGPTSVTSCRNRHERVTYLTLLPNPKGSPSLSPFRPVGLIRAPATEPSSSWFTSSHVLYVRQFCSKASTKVAHFGFSVPMLYFCSRVASSTSKFNLDMPVSIWKQLDGLLVSDSSSLTVAGVRWRGYMGYRLYVSFAGCSYQFRKWTRTSSL